MRFLRRAEASPTRLAILPAAFHPPTLAHLALAEAALPAFADEVLFVLPAAFPHKQYEQLTAGQRAHLVALATGHEPRFSVAISEGGLFLEIARECRAVYGARVQLRFLCGRDAAERIVGWDYGSGPSIEAQLEEFELVVAPRNGPYTPPQTLIPRIHPLAVDPAVAAISSTEVRNRMAAGRPWKELVPASIHQALIDAARRSPTP